MDTELVPLLLAAISDFERKSVPPSPALVLTVQVPASPSKKPRRVKVKPTLTFLRVRDFSCVSSQALSESLRLPAVTTISEVSENILVVTGDSQFFLKTVNRAEFTQLESCSARYSEYVTENRHSTLVHVLGLYKVTVYGAFRKTKRMVILMENVFRQGELVQERFDLKGSEVGRRSLDGEIGKDVNFRQKGTKIALGADAKQRFMAQIAEDVGFLQSQGLFDYSLLVGISHEAETWAATSPTAVRHQYTSADGKRLYLLAIIDIGTAYSAGRQIENAAKSLIFDGEEISCVPPERYAERFLTAVERAVE